MTRFTAPAVCACLALSLTACGEVPTEETTPADIAPPGPGLQQVSFTGVGDPATGRLQIFMGPQPAIGTIAEDNDGSATTVAGDRVQVYGPAVNFVTRGAAGYPAACTGPQAMVANVEIFSGFKEQLRNVYARITSKSSGQTFCALATPGAIAPPAGTYSGLYFYQPLNSGTSPSFIKRSVEWSMNLPDQSPFWFSGDVWAEVIPAPPTLVAPADNLRIQSTRTRPSVTLSWTNDPRADGGTSGETSYAVPRPSGGAYLTVYQCGSAGTASAPVAFDPALCRATTYYTPVSFTRTTSSHRVRYDRGFWYQWSLQTSFLLPGSTTRIRGSTLVTRHFAVVQ